jgi:hypothetical protein
VFQSIFSFWAAAAAEARAAAGGSRARAWEESWSGQRSWVGCGSKRARLAPFYGVASEKGVGKMTREAFPEHGID